MIEAIVLRELISQYKLTYETEINGITYYTSEKEDGYYFIDDKGTRGIFESKEKFYKWANMRERINFPLNTL